MYTVHTLKCCHRAASPSLLLHWSHRQAWWDRLTTYLRSGRTHIAAIHVLQAPYHWKATQRENQRNTLEWWQPLTKSYLLGHRPRRSHFLNPVLYPRHPRQEYSRSVEYLTHSTSGQRGTVRVLRSYH